MQPWLETSSLLDARTTPTSAQDFPAAPTAESRARRLQVLLVDDSPKQLQHASDLLSLWKIVPTTAGDGAQALALACERRFDIILMDVAMPVMDGLQATQRIRQVEREHPGRPRTPIVACTTSWLLRNKVLLARVGFDEAINNPCSAEEMNACLRRWSLMTAAHPTRANSASSPPSGKSWS